MRSITRFFGAVAGVLTTCLAVSQTKTLNYKFPKNLSAPVEYYGDVLRLVTGNSEVTQLEKPVRERSKIRLSLKPASATGGSFEYQIALAPINSRLPGSKLGNSLIQFGAISAGGGDIGPIVDIPFLPDFELGSSTQKAVQSSKGDPLSLANLKSLLGSGSTYAISIASRIYSTGNCPIFIRTVHKDAKGDVIGCSNNVRIDLNEQPIGTAKVAAVFYDTLSNPNGLKLPEYYQAINTSNTKLFFKYYWSGVKASKFKVQLSKTPFDPESGTWSSPVHNLAQLTLPAPTNSKDGELIESSIDLKGVVPQANASPQNYFLRVIPLDDKGRLVGNPSNSLTWIHEQKPANWLKSVPQSKPNPRTEVSVSAAYTPAVKDHPEAARYWILKQDLKLDTNNLNFLMAKAYASPSLPADAKVIPKGTRLVFPLPGASQDAGWVDAVVSAISSIADIVQAIVNWASKAYSDLQVLMAQAIGSLTGVDPDLILGGIKIGLAALGIPPEIPNFEQLVDQGLDYVVAQAVSAAGVPDSEYLRGKLKSGLKQGFQEATKSGPITPAPWIPDPNYLAKPEMVELTFRAKWIPEGTSQKPTPSQSFTINLMAKSKLTDQGSPAYSRILLKKPISVPSMLPGQTITVKLPVTEFDTYWVYKSLEQNSDIEWSLGNKTTTTKFKSTWSILSGQ